jgi:hypothetical protein
VPLAGAVNVRRLLVRLAVIFAVGGCEGRPGSLTDEALSDSLSVANRDAEGSICELAEALRTSPLPRFDGDPNSVALLESTDTWSLQDAGAQPDPSVPLFRAASGFFATDGSIGVTNFGMNEILVFGSDGALAARIGGPGAGPEEFRQIYSSRLGPDGQTVLAFDALAQAIKRFTLAGEFLGSERIDSTATSRLDDVFPTPDGGFIAQQRATYSGARAFGEVQYGRVSILQVGPAGASVREIADIPAYEQVRYELEPPRFAISSIPFGAWPWIVVDSQGCLVHPVEREPVVAVRTADGDLVVRIVFPFLDLSLSARAWDAELQRRREVEQRSFPEIPQPFANRPGWSGGQYDGSTRIWLEEYHQLEESAPGWWVVDLLAGTVGFAPAPSGASRLLAVTPDRAAVVMRDALDVETVKMFRVFERP